MDNNYLKKLGNLIPGPPEHPLEHHNLNDIARTGGLHNFQLLLHETYGDVARFWLSDSTLVVSINDPELLKKTKKVGDRPQELFKFLEPLLGPDNWQVIPAEKAKERRKIILPALGHHLFLKSSFNTIVSQTKFLIQKWSLAVQKKEIVELQKDLTQLTLNIISSVAFGYQLDRNDRGQKLVESFENIVVEFINEQYQLPSAFSPEERKKKLNISLSILHDTVNLIIQERIAYRNKNEKREYNDLLNVLIENQLPSEELHMGVLGFLLGGFHTTGVAISWVLYLLSQHPDIAMRVYKEIDDAIKSNRDLDYDDLDKLDYFSMVLKESMRKYSPAPYAAREIQQELEIGGYVIPAKATILYPIYAVHKNPKYWQNPEKFDPDRFSESNIKNIHELAYIPFGFGPRSCSGIPLALLEIKVILVMLLREFSFELVPKHPVVPVDRFVLWSEHDIKVTLSKR